MNTRRQRESLRWKQKPIPELVRLAWPIAVSMLSYSVMTLVSTLFVGRLGANALAAVGLGGIAAFGLIVFSFGLLRAVKVVVSQATGAGKRRDIPVYVATGVLFAVTLGVLSVALGRALAHVLPRFSAVAPGQAPGGRAVGGGTSARRSRSWPWRCARPATGSRTRARRWFRPWPPS
ncbi:MAG: MATE family efflux transporter [Polyangiaceae bacterium]